MENMTMKNKWEEYMITEGTWKMNKEVKSVINRLSKMIHTSKSLEEVSYYNGLIGLCISSGISGNKSVLGKVKGFIGYKV